ncbi:MAG: MurT ligase domain-containing protein [Gaiellaceae bacterium]
MRVRPPLAISLLAARTAGVLSRRAGRGGGTTIPGRVLNALDPQALQRLARRLPQGCVLISATNGKTTSAAMVSAILSERVRLAHNRAGANLVSGVASTLLDARDAQLGLFEVDEAALATLAPALQPRVLCLGNLFRDQLDRYGELEQIAERWRAVVHELPADSMLVVNADDPRIADLARERERVLRFGIDDPQRGGPLPHAADAKLCVRCGAPYEYARAYVGHLGEYHCPNCGHSRPPLDLAARSIALQGLHGSSFQLQAGDDSRAVRLGLPGLYNVYNALAAASVGRALGLGLDDVVAGLERVAAAFGRSERLEIQGRRLLLLLIKNPAGANEVVRTLVESGAPGLLVLALNDDVADGRDVSWIWDVDFEPLLGGLERLIATGTRAAELALRFKYGGLSLERIEVVPDLELALDRGLELTPLGHELVVCPTYTAMLALQKLLTDRGVAAPYWRRQSADARGDASR